MDILPKYGDIRERKTFAWFPLFVGGQFSWFERVIMIEQYTQESVPIFSNFNSEVEGYTDGWVILDIKK